MEHSYLGAYTRCILAASNEAQLAWNVERLSAGSEIGERPSRELDEARLETHLPNRGFMNRILGRLSLLDCLDGLFMSVAYDWAFLNPVRKVYYNISITGLSVAVAFLVGTIELVSVLHDNAGWVNPVTTWISGIDLNNVGFIVVGLFVATWAVALGYWRIAKIEDR